MSRRPYVEIFTDGSCDSRSGAGGWGCILVHPRSRFEKELHGPHPNTTNNRMEMTAAIKGLETLDKPCEVLITTDSQYLKRGITEWISSWRTNDWTNAEGKPVANRDLWEYLDELCQVHEVEWQWVRGHSGHLYNERADRLAAAGRAKITWK